MRSVTVAHRAGKLRHIVFFAVIFLILLSSSFAEEQTPQQQQGEQTRCPSYDYQQMQAECEKNNGMFSTETDATGCIVVHCDVVQQQPSPAPEQPITEPTQPEVPEEPAQPETLPPTETPPSSQEPPLVQPMPPEMIPELPSITACPVYALDQIKENCIALNGNFYISKDADGCDAPQCTLNEIKPPVAVPQCPSYALSFDEMKNECAKISGVFSFSTDTNGCQVPSCQTPSRPAIIQPPQACTQFFDPDTNAATVVCRQQCPNPQNTYNKCIEYGGTPVQLKTAAGCSDYICQMQSAVKPPASVNPITGFERCPKKEEVDASLQKCRDAGLHATTSQVGGCTISLCSSESVKECPLVSEDARMKKEQECAASGKHAGGSFNADGCLVLECKEQGFCEKELPGTAVERCKSNGGEMVVQYGQGQCITSVKCITRGNDFAAALEQPVAEVPDAATLLDVALKLEQLKIELEKLAEQAGQIESYYEEKDSPEAARYQRVSAMFSSATKRVDEIRENIKENVDSMAAEDVSAIKQDIRYLKEVVLKDIVYVMLSSSDDVKEIETGVQEACDRDTHCFERAFRICKPMKFMPNGIQGPAVEIVGVEDEKCVMKVILSPENIPDEMPLKLDGPVEMVCRVADYSLGMQFRDPEQMLSSCSGKLVDIMKGFMKTRMGKPRYEQSASFPPPEGGPGGCKTLEECAAYCETRMEECNRWGQENMAEKAMPAREIAQ